MKITYSNKLLTSSSYPFESIDQKVAQLKKQGIEVIDFGVGDPKTPTPEFVINNLTTKAEERKSFGYPSYIGELNYRQACAKHMLEHFGVSLNPDTEISSTVGSKEAIFNFPIGFINPGDTVICPTPGYPVYKIGTEFAGGKLYMVPLLEENNFLIDFESIPEEIAKTAKIIWTNYPNSPTGATAPIEWLKKLCSWAEKYNIIIAADEGCYIDIYFKEKPHSILEIKKEGIITFYSLSKRSNMTGYRVGFVAGDERIVTGFRKVKTNIDSGTPAFIQDVAALALADNNHAIKMREEYRQKREILLPALKSIGLEETTANSTFYIWQKVPKHMTDIDFAHTLVDIGIVVTPGSLISEKIEDFNPGSSFVRLALVPTIEEVKKAAELIRKLEL